MCKLFLMSNLGVLKINKGYDQTFYDIVQNIMSVFLLSFLFRISQNCRVKILLKMYKRFTGNCQPFCSPSIQTSFYTKCAFLLNVELNFFFLFLSSFFMAITIIRYLLLHCETNKLSLQTIINQGYKRAQQSKRDLRLRHSNKRNVMKVV